MKQDDVTGIPIPMTSSRLLPDEFQSLDPPSAVLGLGEEVFEHLLLATLSRRHQRSHPVVVDHRGAATRIIQDWGHTEYDMME